MNRRAEIAMTAEEQAAFLAGSRTIVLSTLDGRGYPHSVAMWFALIDGLVHMTSFRKAQKVVNLRRDPRLTCLVETGESYDQLRGVTLIGTGEIIDDPARMWELGVSVFERYNGPYSEEMKPFVEAMLNKRVVVKLHVDKTVTWDHRKLGLPAM